MVQTLAALLFVTGCGRLAFDRRDQADGATAGDSPTSCQGSPPASVQHACNTVGSIASVDVAMSQPLTAGNLVIVVAEFNGTTQTLALTDTLGSTFVPALPIVQSPTQSAQLFYTFATASATDTVTLTVTPTSTAIALYVHEMSGLSALRAAEGQSGTSGMPMTPSLSTLVPDELVYAHGVIGSTITGVSAGFTVDGVCAGDMTAHRFAATPGSYAATFTMNQAANWVATLAVFRGSCP